MSLTATVVLQRLADFIDMEWDVAGAATGTATEERRKRRLITCLNSAIEWAAKGSDPSFAWPWQVSSGTVTVTNDKIAAADLGEGSWCSLWTADPRAIGNRAYPLNCMPDTDGGARLTLEGLPTGVSPASVFAFYRTTTPQITYAVGTAYPTPTLPDRLIQPILLYAIGLTMAGLVKNDEQNNYAAQALAWVESAKNALFDGNLIWIKNGTALI